MVKHLEHIRHLVYERCYGAAFSLVTSAVGLSYVVTHASGSISMVAGIGGGHMELSQFSDDDGYGDGCGDTELEDYDDEDLLIGGDGCGAAGTSGVGGGRQHSGRGDGSALYMPKAKLGTGRGYTDLLWENNPRRLPWRVRGEDDDRRTTSV